MELILLVRKAQSGDRGAIAEICRRFTGLVKKYAFQSHVRLIADEALSQGWLEVVQGIQHYDEQTGVPFAGYVESRVKYGIWNLFKRERRRWEQEVQLDGGNQEEEGLSLLEQLPAATNVASEVGGKFLGKELMEAIARLPAKQGRVIVATVVDEERLTALAAEWGITPQAVYNLRQRGLTRLKKELIGIYKDIRQT